MLEVLLLLRLTAQTKFHKNYSRSGLYFAEEVGTGGYQHFPAELHLYTFKEIITQCCSTV